MKNRFMKKIIFILALFVSITAGAQKLTWYQEIPKECSKINITFDYSTALMKGMSFDENVIEDEAFPQDVREAETRFITTFNNYASRHKNAFLISRAIDFDYFMVVIPSIIRPNGDFKGDIVIRNKDGETIAKMEKISKRGGTYGSFPNLMGDGYENVAEFVAVRICFHRRKM